jgi:hypothetical protein
MAVTFKDEQGRTVGTRVNMYYMETHQLRLRPKNCGRHQQRSKEDYALLRADIFRAGQRDPIIIGKDGDIPIILDGAGRYEVICDLNEHELKANPMKVACVYEQGNEVDGLWTAIQQNRIRSGIVPIDDAYNIKAARRLNLTDEEIAEGYFPGCLADKKNRQKALSWVARRESLLNLTNEAQQALSDGEIKVTAAENLAKLQAEQQRKEMEKGGKVTAKDIRKAAGKVEKLSVKQVKNELDSVIADYATVKGVPKELLDVLQSLRDRL